MNINSESDVSHTPSSGNVFEDIRLSNSKEHLEKSKIVMSIQENITKSQLNLSDASEKIGISEADLTRIIVGNFSKISIDDLSSYLSKLT